MGRRLDLQAILEGFVQANGGLKAYFQPPANIQMSYPTIVYERDNLDYRRADNVAYGVTDRYQVTVIDRDPESPISELVAALPMCVFSRRFASDNLNHDIFTLYY